MKNYKIIKTNYVINMEYNEYSDDWLPLIKNSLFRILKKELDRFFDKSIIIKN